MTGISTLRNFTENTQFQGSIDSSLGRADPSLGATRIRATLDTVDPNKLSTQEKNVLMSTVDLLSRDGNISPADADTVTSLVRSFESSGRFTDTVFGGNSGRLDVPQGWTPSPTADAAARSPSNPMFGGLLGFVVDKVVQAFKDGLFMGAGQGMLGTCDGCQNQQDVSKALGDADLSKLNPRERSQILQQIGFASLDGRISKAESNAIIDTLNRAQGIKPPQNGDWQVKQDGGKAQIDLGKYTLDLNEGNSEFILTNKETGEKTRVWGDPHFQTTDANGNLQNVGDFYGTTTLNLDDGTKITIHTTPWAAGGNGATLATELVITQGDKAMVVQGLDQNKLGDLRIGQVANGGRLVDAVNEDGANIYENPEGTGWLRMNQGGFLTQVDGAFLSTIRYDGDTGTDRRDERITPIRRDIGGR